LTARQAQLIQDTYALIRPEAKATVLIFYGRLFQLDPSARPMFRNDLHLQARKLVSTLETVVESLDNWDAISPRLRELGRRHVTYGVKREQYATVNTALVWALSQALDIAASVEVRQAWTQLLEEISAEMLQGARTEELAPDPQLAAARPAEGGTSENG
jgi:hemoglobin-like flavoprotein